MSFIGDTFEQIRSAYYTNGSPKVPTDKELKQIESKVAEMNLFGNICVASAGMGLVGSYVVYQIPYVGPIASFVLATASVGMAAIGNDLSVASTNLKKCSEARLSNVATNVFSTCLNGSDVSEEMFIKNLLKEAAERTIIAKLYLDYAFAIENKSANRAS